MLTWDLANRLAARPVERGEALRHGRRPGGRLATGARRRRRSHRPRARSTSQPKQTEALPVRFRLRSADAPYTGHIEKIGMTASVDTKDAAAARPTIEVVVAFDKHELTEAAQRDLRPGVTARAEIDCGRRSLGYVWLHDLWDAAITWLRF